MKKILIAVNDYQSETSLLYRLTEEQVKLLEELESQKLLADGIFYDEVGEPEEI